MDRRDFPNRFLMVILLVAGGALAGCSGSSSAGSGDTAGGEAPPAEQPPAADPPTPADPSAAPSVNLTAADTVVPAGDDVVLTWSSQNATACNASGGWSGSKPAQGSATVGPLSQSTTFTLTCTSAGGNAMAMLSVSVLGVVSLAWEPPTENVDGSPLTDLAGYRIYYGEFSGSYTDELAIQDDAGTRYDVTLPSGSYYFAMTALDAEGNESAYSNEVVKVVN